MLVSELLAEAGRELGDTTDDFRDSVLMGCLRMVLLECAADELLIGVRRSAERPVIAGETLIDIRELVQQPFRIPIKIASLEVPAWGALGIIPEVAYSTLVSERQQSTTTLEGTWQAWARRDAFTIEVYPAASEAYALDDDGQAILASVFYDAPPEKVELTDQIVELHEEDLPLIVAGLKLKAAQFRETLPEEYGLFGQEYAMRRGRAWARKAGNLRVGIIRPNDF